MIQIIKKTFRWSHLYTIIFDEMKSKRIMKGLSVLLLGTILSVSSLRAAGTENAVSNGISMDAKKGMSFFEGSRRFQNGGPACVTCHNVVNNTMIPGGVLAKDLTDVYSRMGEGITAWLGAPPFPAMVSSYQNHPLTEEERSSLTAFFKYANETKDKQNSISATSFFTITGSLGLLIIIILISLIWMKRKKEMVKQDIFSRQSRAWDAKH